MSGTVRNVTSVWVILMLLLLLVVAWAEEFTLTVTGLLEAVELVR
jgi:hypothetical protein